MDKVMLACLVESSQATEYLLWHERFYPARERLVRLGQHMQLVLSQTSFEEEMLLVIPRAGR